jgi:hypothetical protein
MAICTLAQVKASARIDGSEFDAEIGTLIPAVQSLVEHECGVASGTFDTAPDAAATQCAIALCVSMLNDTESKLDSFHPILRSALLDKARSWL